MFLLLFGISAAGCSPVPPDSPSEAAAVVARWGEPSGQQDMVEAVKLHILGMLHLSERPNITRPVPRAALLNAIRKRYVGRVGQDRSVEIEDEGQRYAEISEQAEQTSEIITFTEAVLQVFSVYGTSLLLNGAVGESIVLPTNEKGPFKGPGLIQWKNNNIVVMQLERKQDSSTFEKNVINETFKGRLIMNHETGALRITSLREEDSGEYVFDGFGSSRPLGPKTIQLHIYERIISVQVTSEVNNSTDNSSCNVILSCNVIGASQVALSWSRNGENIAGAENRSTLTVSPTHAEEDYTCTAINPIGSLSNTVTARPCQTPEIRSFLYSYIAAGGGGLLVVMVITCMCIRKKSKRGEVQEDAAVYAEIGDNLHTQTGSVNCQTPQPADVITFCEVTNRSGTPAATSTVYDVLKLDRATATQNQDVL